MPRILRTLAGCIVLVLGVTAPQSWAQSATTGASLAEPACTIVGTSAGEELVGTNAADVICALEGNDIVRGLKGNDVLVGGPGDDQLFGGGGSDELRGEAGFDFLQGDGADDALYGGPDGDTFNATRGTTAGVVADGADLMVGGDGSDTVRYLQRLAGVNVSLDGAANDGAAGENDQVGVPQGPLARPDVENVDGGMGDDVLVGTNGPNFLVSRRGADTIRGLGGADTIDVRDRDRDSAWNDVVDAGDGPDYCAANRADDLTSCEQVFFG